MSRLLKHKDVNQEFEVKPRPIYIYTDTYDFAQYIIKEFRGKFAENKKH